MGPRERGNVLSVSVKGREFLDCLLSTTLTPAVH